MMEQKEMTYDDFLEKYTPIKNHICKTAPLDGCMFETIREEYEFVKNQDPKNVWTLIDCDGWYGIAAGFHFINRLGYVITEEPWESVEEEFTISDEGPVNDWFWSLSIEEKKSLFPHLKLDPNLYEEDQLEDEWHDNCVDEKEEIMIEFKNKNNETTDRKEA